MQKAFEKIIERLEEKSKRNAEMGYMTANDVTKECIEIVNQVAEKYKRTAHFGCNTNGEHERCDSCGVADKCPDYKKELFEQFGNSKQEEVCEWRLCDEEGNVYDTTCRNPHIPLEGSPIDNNYEFCPYCGKKIKAVE